MELDNLVEFLQANPDEIFPAYSSDEERNLKDELNVSISKRSLRAKLMKWVEYGYIDYVDVEGQHYYQLPEIIEKVTNED